MMDATLLSISSTISTLIDKSLASRKSLLLWGAVGTVALVVTMPFLSGLTAFVFLRKRKPQGIDNPSDEEFGDASMEAALDATAFREFTLTERVQLTHDTCRIRFLIPNGRCLQLPVGRHVQVLVPDAGKPGAYLKRFYSPTSPPNAKGYFDLVVKAYPDGVVSRYLHAIPVGSVLLVRGPTGSHSYKPNQFTHIGVLAAGSGITPVLSLLHAVLGNREDRTAVTLVYANKTDRDIILKDELDQMAVHAPARFSVHYVVGHTDQPTSWSGSVGQITESLVREHLFTAQQSKFRICVCGPAGFTKSVKEICAAIGYPADSVVGF